MYNTRIFNYKFFGPTTYLGARIKIEDKWFGESITMSFDYRAGNVAEQAIKYLESIGLPISGYNSEYQIIICQNWTGDIRLTKSKE